MDTNPLPNTGSRSVFAWLRPRFLLALVAVLLALVGTGQAAAQSGSATQADAELVQRIRDAVIRELRESGALDREIDQGIERYVARQRAAAAQREENSADARAGKVRPVSKTNDHIRGNPNAPVSLIEYSDFECPFCKRFHDTAKQIVQQYGGKVNWVYRHFPLDFHNPAAQREAEAAECAAELGGNEAFWRFTDLIYTRTLSNGKGVPETELPGWRPRSVSTRRSSSSAWRAAGRAHGSGRISRRATPSASTVRPATSCATTAPAQSLRGMARSRSSSSRAPSTDC